MASTAPRQEKYDETNPVVRFLLARFFARVRSATAGVPPGTILDAGSGEGELLRRGVLARTPVCVDLRVESLAAIDPATPRVCGSLDRLPFTAQSFDLVVCLEVLEHLDDPMAALQELARVARGPLVFSVPWEPWFQLGNLARGKHREQWGNHPEHVQHWNPGSFRRFLQGTFREVEIATAFPWIVARVLP